MLYVEVIRQAMNDAFMKLPKKTSKTFKYESKAKQEAIFCSRQTSHTHTRQLT